jgi:hypothetical protein
VSIRFFRPLSDCSQALDFVAVTVAKKSVSSLFSKLCFASFFVFDAEIKTFCLTECFRVYAVETAVSLHSTQFGEMRYTIRKRRKVGNVFYAVEMAVPSRYTAKRRFFGTIRLSLRGMTALPRYRHMVAPWSGHMVADSKRRSVSGA